MSFSNDRQKESGSSGEDRWGGIGRSRKFKKCLLFLQRMGVHTPALTAGDSPGDPMPSLAPAGTQQTYRYIHINQNNKSKSLMSPKQNTSVKRSISYPRSGNLPIMLRSSSNTTTLGFSVFSQLSATAKNTANKQKRKDLFGLTICVSCLCCFGAVGEDGHCSRLMQWRRSIYPGGNRQEGIRIRVSTSKAGP